MQSFLSSRIQKRLLIGFFLLLTTTVLGHRPDNIDIQIISNPTSQLSWKTAFPTWIEPFGEERVATILARWVRRNERPAPETPEKIRKFNLDWRWTYYPAILKKSGKVILTAPQGIRGGWYELIPRIKLKTIDPTADEKHCALIATTDRFRLHCLNSYLETLATYDFNQSFEDFDIVSWPGEEPLVVILNPKKEFWLTLVQPETGNVVARLLTRWDIQEKISALKQTPETLSSIENFYRKWQNKPNWQPLRAGLVVIERHIDIVFVDPLLVIKTQVSMPEPGRWQVKVQDILPVHLDNPLLEPPKGQVHFMSLVAAFTAHAGQSPVRNQTLYLYVLNHQSRPLSFWKTYDPLLYMEYKQIPPCKDHPEQCHDNDFSVGADFPTLIQIDLASKKAHAWQDLTIRTPDKIEQPTFLTSVEHHQWWGSFEIYDRKSKQFHVFPGKLFIKSDE